MLQRNRPCQTRCEQGPHLTQPPSRTSGPPAAAWHPALHSPPQGTGGVPSMCLGDRPPQAPWNHGTVVLQVHPVPQGGTECGLQEPNSPRVTT